MVTHLVRVVGSKPFVIFAATTRDDSEGVGAAKLVTGEGRGVVKEL